MKVAVGGGGRVGSLCCLCLYFVIGQSNNFTCGLTTLN